MLKFQKAFEKIPYVFRVSRGFLTFEGPIPSTYVATSLKNIGLDLDADSKLAKYPLLKARSAIDGQFFFSISGDTEHSYHEKVLRALVAGQQMSESTTPHIRADFLEELKDLFDKYRPDIARILTYEIAKTKEEAYVEVDEAINTLRLSKKMPDKMHGRIYASRDPKKEMREIFVPLSLAGQIAPINFPFSIPLKHALMAFVVGVPVINKPSEHTLLSGMSLKKLFDMAVVNYLKKTGIQIPEDAFQIVLGGKELSAND